MPLIRDLALDLGTANTLVYERDAGVVLNEPTLITMNERSGDVLAMGNDAWAMLADAPESVVAVRPLRHGAIADFDVTERLVKMVFRRIGIGRFSHPRVVVTVSTANNVVERRAVEEAVLAAGARSATLIDEPIAAALGAGLPIDQPAGNCVIDVGGGTTEVAIVSMGSVVAARAVRVGGFDIDDAIQKLLRREHGIAIGERMAESIKKEIGSAWPSDDEPSAEIRGRELETGRPKSVVLTAEELRAGIEEHVAVVVDSVRQTLAECPPELSHDVLDRGMYLTGGGALLRGLDARLEAETTIPVHVTDAPLETVVTGAGRSLAAAGRFRGAGSPVS